VEILSRFEIPTDAADDYGTVVRGYVVPPVSGDYIFWIASDDNSILYLSSTSDPKHARPIARVGGWTPPRAWDASPEQRSEPVKLEAGKRYYIEAIHREGGGGDHLAVGWQLPDGSQERPLPGHRLLPAGLPAALRASAQWEALPEPRHRTGTHRLNAKIMAGSQTWTLPVLLTFPAQPSASTLVLLHAESASGSDLQAVVEHGLGAPLRAENTLPPCLLIEPQLPPDKAWTDAAVVRAVNAAVSALLSTLGLADRSVLAAGSGQGASGAALLALEQPSRYAAVAAFTLPSVPPEFAVAGPEWLLGSSAGDAEGQTRASAYEAAVRKAGGRASLVSLPAVAQKSPLSDAAVRVEILRRLPQPVVSGVAVVEKQPAVAREPAQTPAVTEGLSPRDIHAAFVLATFGAAALCLLGACWAFWAPLKS
jgi:predicted esterase